MIYTDNTIGVTTKQYGINLEASARGLPSAVILSSEGVRVVQADLADPTPFVLR